MYFVVQGFFGIFAPYFVSTIKNIRYDDINNMFGNHCLLYLSR